MKSLAGEDDSLRSIETGRFCVYVSELCELLHQTPGHLMSSRMGRGCVADAAFRCTTTTQRQYGPKHGGEEDRLCQEILYVELFQASSVL